MSVTAISTTSTISLPQGAGASPAPAESDAQVVSGSASASPTTASSTVAATVAPASSSPIDAIAQQIAQYTDILNDTTGTYSIEQQAQADDAVGALLGYFVGPNGSAVWHSGNLSEADVSAVFNAQGNTAFGAQVQSIQRKISQAEIGGDTGGIPSDSQNPSSGLQKGFESLSDTDKQIYLALDLGGKAYDGWSVADYETNLQANTDLQGYIEKTEKADKVTDAEIDAGKIDPTLKAALVLQGSSETSGFANSVNSLLGSLDSATSAATQASAAYAAPGSTTAAVNASIAEGKKALASLTSAPTTVTNASVVLTVLQNAAAKSQAATKTNADLKSGSAQAGIGQGASASGSTSSGSWPYTQGSIANTNA